MKPKARVDGAEVDAVEIRLLLSHQTVAVGDGANARLIDINSENAVN